jgi:L-lactate dehydrogenase
MGFDLNAMEKWCKLGFLALPDGAAARAYPFRCGSGIVGYDIQHLERYMKISIIGLGNVGSTLAYTLILKGVASELVLVDKNENRALGDALDLEHCQSFGPRICSVKAGTVEDTAGSGLVIIAASIPWDPATMKARQDLAMPNHAFFRSLIPSLVAVSPDAVLLVITNPVDVMTYFAWEFSGLPAGRVLGSGTLVDSARFRIELSRSLNIHPDDIRAYVLGEHGPSQFPALSATLAGGQKITDVELCMRLFASSSLVGDQIVKAKGYTNFAVASAAALIAECIATDAHRTIPVSTLIEGTYGVSKVCLSLPGVIGKNGLEKILVPDLAGPEVELFRLSAKAVGDLIATVKASSN